MNARPTGHRVGPLAATGVPAPGFDLDALLDDRSRRIILCCGAGGVGKTTTAAAIGLRAAERGRRVVVLTIDPARRLAQSMGIKQLDNTPRPVPGTGPSTSSGTGSLDGAARGSLDGRDSLDPAAHGSLDGRDSLDGAAHGSLDAMMLDMKRTFDEVVLSQASPEKARQILENPFYIAVSSSFAGTQEYMAMEKLGQLDADARRSGRWDLIVVDTPPSRNALDFLDAPERLSSFLDGRFMRLLLAPARGPAKLMTAGFGLVTRAITTIVGAQVLGDMQAFVAAFDTLFGGFRQRAQRTYELLQADGTAFLVVAAPEPDALREAAYFVERLREEHMPLAGLVLNRASTDPGPELSEAAARAAAERLRNGDDDERLAAGLLRLHADRKVVVARETRLRERFATAHPDVPTGVVPALSTDVHDLDGLRRVGGLLAASGAGAEVGADAEVRR